MKKLIFASCIIFIAGFNPVHAQITTEDRTEEYATIRAVVSAQTGSFSTTTTLPNPFLEMEKASMELKDVISHPDGVKFKSLTEMINYMNKFGWIMLGSTNAEIPGSETGDFMLFYTFKRKPKRK